MKTIKQVIKKCLKWKCECTLFLLLVIVLVIKLYRNREDFQDNTPDNMPNTYDNVYNVNNAISPVNYRPDPNNAFVEAPIFAPTTTLAPTTRPQLPPTTRPQLPPTTRPQLPPFSINLKFLRYKEICTYINSEVSSLTDTQKQIIRGYVLIERIIKFIIKQKFRTDDKTTYNRFNTIIKDLQVLINFYKNRSTLTDKEQLLYNCAIKDHNFLNKSIRKIQTIQHLKQNLRIYRLQINSILTEQETYNIKTKFRIE